MGRETADRQKRLRRSLDESGVYLFEEMCGRLLRYARSRGLDEAASEEVVQEAFTAIIQRRGSVEHPEAWLVRVVNRRCCDWLRRRSTRNRALETLSKCPGRSDRMPSNETLDLARALARLPAKMRQALRLRYLDEVGSDEAASRLGYSCASYRSTLSRALEALRRHLGVDTRSPSRVGLDTVGRQARQAPAASGRGRSAAAGGRDRVQDE